jgi:hypothetical protein
MRRSVRQWFLCALLVCITCSPCFSADYAGEGAQGVTSASFVGEWSEHWNPSGQTDVTYHDHYKVSQEDNGTIKVTILNRKQLIKDEHIEKDTLTFTQHTDRYVVKYSLTIQPGNKWMIGTAITPKKVVPVKWERIK